MTPPITRLHYRAHLTHQPTSAAITQCCANIRRLQSQHLILTAALYQYNHMLFLYYEASGSPIQVIEPIQAAAPSPSLPLESGEDIQSDFQRPEDLLSPLTPYLAAWPGQTAQRTWVHMYHIFCHSYPQSLQQWARPSAPSLRRGRIAFLREDKLFSYIYYHKALVDEGLIKGDKYQSIALHENILFSYFEEPKTIVNIQNDSARESRILPDWIAADPESHFIHMPGSNGENFLFLPALFALGIEDEKGTQSHEQI